MTSELVPWRGHSVPVLTGEISRYSINDYFNWMQESFKFGGITYNPGQGYTTTYGKNPSEPIGNNFVGYVQGLLYADGVVAAVEQTRIRIFSQAPLLFQERRDGRPGDLYDDPSLELAREPWIGGTTSDLQTRALLYADFGGNAYVVAADGELVVLRPDWVEIILAERYHNGGRLGFKQVGIAYYEGGRQASEAAVFTRGEYAHFAPLPDPLASYRGMSWLTPVLREVQSDIGATVHGRAFFENAATPNLAVSLPKEITPTQFEEFRAKMRAEHTGAANAYRTLYTGGGADVTVIGANMQQMDFRGVQGKLETRIANAAGIHPAIVGLSEGMQGSSLNAGNYGMAKRATVDTTGRHLWQNWCGSMQVLFPPPKAGDRLWYDARDIPFLHEDQKDAAEIQQTLAATISSYITSGFEPDSAVEAVDADDRKLLKHSGRVSVQLFEPGQGPDADGDGAPDTGPVDFGALREGFSAQSDEPAEEPATRSRFDDFQDVERRYHPDQLRVPKGFEGGGRFRSLSTRLVKILDDWLDQKGDGDPLEEFDQPQLREVAKDLGLLQPRQRTSKPQLKGLLYQAIIDDRGGKSKRQAPDVKKPPEWNPDPNETRAEKKARIQATDPADLPNEELPDAFLYAHGDKDRTAKLQVEIDKRKAAAGGKRIGSDREQEFGGKDAEADAAGRKLAEAGGKYDALSDGEVRALARGALLPGIAQKANDELKRRGLPEQTWSRADGPVFGPGGDPITSGPLSPRAAKILHDADASGAAGRLAVTDGRHDADIEELRARGLVKFNPIKGIVEITPRGRREVAKPDKPAPAKAAKKATPAKATPRLTAAELTELQNMDTMPHNTRWSVNDKTPVAARRRIDSLTAKGYLRPTGEPGGYEMTPEGRARARGEGLTTGAKQFQEHVPQNKARGTALSGRDAHKAALVTEPLSPEAQDALEHYGIGGSSVVNAMLRGSGGEITESQGAYPAQTARALKALMADHALADDITVYRGVPDIKDVLRRSGRPKVGDTFVDHGFVSAGTDKGFEFDTPGSVQMTVHAPKGTRALSVPDAGDGRKKILDRGEVVLDQGYTYRITGVRQDDNGIWHVDAEVVPESSSPAKAAKKATPRKAAAPSPTGEGGLSSDPAVREVQVENRIRAAYNELPKGAGIWVGLADLREHPLLRDLSREEVDAALLRGARTGMPIEPFDNRRGMTQRDRDAALHIGGDPSLSREMISYHPSGGGSRMAGDARHAPQLPLTPKARKAAAEPVLSQRQERVGGAAAKVPLASEVITHLAAIPVDFENSMDAEPAAHRYLASLKLTVPQLRQLAADLDVPLVHSTSQGIREDIVKVHLRGRLMTAVIGRYPSSSSPKGDRATEIVSDPTLTLRQKRLRLKALGFTPEQVNDLAPLARSETPDDDLERRHPYPGQKYKHGWIPVAGLILERRNAVAEHVTKWHTDTTDVDHLIGPVASGAHNIGPLNYGPGSNPHLADFGDGTEGVVTTYHTARDADADQLASALGRAIGIPAPPVLRVEEDGTVADLIDGTTWAEREQQILNDIRAYELDGDSPRYAGPRGQNLDQPPSRNAKQRQRVDLERQRAEMLASDAALRLGVLDLLAGIDQRDAGTIVITPDGAVPVQSETGWIYADGRRQPAEIAAGRPSKAYGKIAPVDRRTAPPDMVMWSAFSTTRQWKDNPLTEADIAYLRTRLELMRPQFMTLSRRQWWRFASERLEALAEHAKGTRSLFAAS